MHWNEKLGKCPIPGWLFSVVTVLWCESLLHFWTAGSFQIPRYLTVICFGLGFGGILGLIFSFFGGKKWGKWVSAGVMALVTVLYTVEYFVTDAYVSFMGLGTLLGGAKGVATDFADVVLALIVRDFWRILVFALPVFAYTLLAAPITVSWKQRGLAAGITAAAYALAFTLVFGVGTDAARLTTDYNLDSAIHCFGLNVGLALDVGRGGGSEEAPGEFVVLETAPPVTEEAEQTQPEQTQPEQTQPVVYEPNVMDFDFAQLAENESNSRISSIHKYVNTVTPTLKNEYTGLFKGKNLIIIAAESFSGDIIDPELTPTLYRLATQGIQFTDFYQPMWGGSTSSGEFSILSGLVSASGTNSIKEGRQQDLFLSIGKQLQKEGYYSQAFHNHLYTFYDRDKTHTYYGYDSFMGMHNGMEEGVREVWPESDKEMMDFTVPLYIDQQPFSIYYMTVSGHARYTTDGNAMSRKNIDAVQSLPYSDKVKAYYACQLELEYAMQSLVSQLEEAGISDDTVIVLTADHYPYALEKSATWDNRQDYVSELYGYKPANNAERDHNALILWSGCLEGKNIVVDTPTYSLDILPTLSNLFGVEYDSRLLVGRDVFSDAEPLVLWYDFTWKTEKGLYNPESGKFTPAEGVSVEEGYVDRIKALVQNKIHYSREVQQTDYFNYLAKAMQ